MPLLKFLKDLFGSTPEPVSKQKIHPLDGSTRFKEAPYKIEISEVVAESAKVEATAEVAVLTAPTKVELESTAKKTRKSPVRRAAEKAKASGKKPATATAAKVVRGRKPKAK